MTKKNNTLPVAAGVVIVIVILAAAYYILGQQGTTPPTTTTTVPQPGITTQTVESITTTIVSNLTMAVGPNLASCNGYNYTTSQANLEATGSCGWRGGFMNITIASGGYSDVKLTLIQQNTTIVPFNSTYSVAPCTLQSQSYTLPIGNYKVTFSTGVASTCTPGGSASVRLSR